MENNLEQYEALLDSASEAAEACLDMEGGAFFLAWAGELIQDLVGKGYCRSACLTAQKLCEAVGTNCVWAKRNELEPMEKQAWINLFTEALMDQVMTVCVCLARAPPRRCLRVFNSMEEVEAAVSVGSIEVGAG